MLISERTSLENITQYIKYNNTLVCLEHITCYNKINSVWLPKHTDTAKKLPPNHSQLTCMFLKP